MITKVMKAELGKLGYTPEQIDELTPAEAHRILRGKRKDAKSFGEIRRSGGDYPFPQIRWPAHQVHCVGCGRLGYERL